MPREDESYYHACPKCTGELVLSQGEWVADFPNRDIHGYRISQLFSSKVDPGEILHEYRTTRYPDRFYNMKIGIPWADLERRLDMMSVLSLCRNDLQLYPKYFNFMGVDTGKVLHVVILQRAYDNITPNHTDPATPHHLLYLGTCRDFSELDVLIEKYDIKGCVIDGLPETHATRAFAARHRNKVFLNFFNENQRGKARWDYRNLKVDINRTEALDASRAAILEKLVLLPRRMPIVEEFAKHLTHDAKVLDEDEETGKKKYRYVRTGENHYSMAFTYVWLAISEICVPIVRNL